MPHYAKVLDNKVVNVLSAEAPPSIDDSPGEWIETSYNTRSGIHYDPNTGQPSADQSKALRKNYAGIGYEYNREMDAFIPPRRYESWQLNKDTCLWEAPVAMPSDGKMYSWNESNKSWEETNI